MLYEVITPVIQVSKIEIVSNDELVDDLFDDFSSESNDLEGIRNNFV